jgi:DNA repair photolyase
MPAKIKQKRIISVSRRTDIPAFYSEWFINRIRDGFCCAPNPRYPKQKTKSISLRPEDVEIIIFWTRDPKPLMKYLPELDKRGYKYYFQYTVLDYPREIDPGAPSLDRAIKTFKELSDMIGKEKVIWRYDPILFSDITSFEWHVRQISDISGWLRENTETLVISFIDRIRKEISGNFKLYPDAFEAESYRKLAGWIGLEMKAKGLKVVTCAEKIDLSAYGIGHGKCIDDSLINQILKRKTVSKKDPAQRKACGCVVSRDIGVNDTCLFGCKYCYAARAHNKNSLS